MKIKRDFRNKHRALISLLMLGVFVVLAVASTINERTKYQGNGVYQTTYEGNLGSYNRTYTGARDEHRQWHGPIVIEHQNKAVDFESKEEVTMVHGLRHGRSKVTFGSGRVVYHCYNMGRYYNCDDSGKSSSGNVDIIAMLEGKYPWHLLAYDGYGLSMDTIRAFTDELVNMLTAYEYDYDDFDDEFDDALDVIEENESFAEIALLHSDLAAMIGVEEIKRYEVRRAVLDQHRLSGEGTFATMEAGYADYLNWLQLTYTVDDIHAFCDSIDHKILRYGPLDKEDPLFLDSVDIRFNRAMNEMVFNKSGFTDLQKAEYYADGSQITRSQLRRHARELFQQTAASKSPEDVAFFIAMHMQLTMDLADPLRIVMREALFPDVARLAVVVSVFDRVASPASVAVSGTVTEDGGAPVTERGFVYGQTYNPTLEHSKVAVGSGVGDFSTIIAGLTTGERYFIRTYATNSVGTAYGNQLELVVETSTGVTLPETPSLSFSVYPVPANGMLWVSLDEPAATTASISVLNVSGQVVVSQDLNFAGRQTVSLDISGVRPGAYFVRLDVDGHVAIRKVVLH